MAKTIVAPKPPIVAKAAPSLILPITASNPVSDSTLYMLTALAALFYYFWSTVSPGFYQQDEAGHFLGMIDFWNDPGSILGNWAKWGYKMLYVVPAKLGGKLGVIILNCVLAASSALLIAKSLRAQGNALALAGFFLLALQPLWIGLSFRNYSEIPTAFLLSLAYYLHVQKRATLSMLAISYICTIRQEFYPLLAVYGLNLLFRRQFVAAFSAIVFPFLQHCYGWYFTGDSLYLIHQLVGQGVGQDAWPRQGFDHYFLTSMVIFGPAVVTLFVHYALWGLVKREKIDFFIVVPAITYFIMQCLFNTQAFKIGPSTGGNLRYLIIISPLLAAGAAQGLWYFTNAKEKVKALYYLVPLVLVTAIYLNHKSDLLKLLEEKDPFPVVGVMLACGLLFIPMAASAKSWAVGGLMALSALMAVRPIKMSDEDKTAKLMAEWFTKNEASIVDKPWLVNHVMFYYWLGRTRGDFSPKPNLLVSQEQIEKMPAGTTVIWDSHYGYRPRVNPKSLNYDYFQQRPQQYDLLSNFMSNDQGFAFIVFRKK